jgi:hypothetical protein
MEQLYSRQSSQFVHGTDPELYLYFHRLGILGPRHRPDTLMAPSRPRSYLGPRPAKGEDGIAIEAPNSKRNAISFSVP